MFLEGQVDAIFAGLKLRPDWVDWIIQNCAENADRNENLQRRAAVQREIERAQDLCVQGDWSR